MGRRPLDQEDSPVAMAHAYRRVLQRSNLRGDPQVAWPGAPLLERQDLPGAAAVERSVDIAAVPVEEVHPDQIRMRLAPRDPHDWSQVELDGRFFNRRVYFLTWDGHRVEAEVARFRGFIRRAVPRPGRACPWPRSYDQPLDSSTPGLLLGQPREPDRL
jgi:hypothetical protein